jgi:ubiquinone/menaquinone biosynthesis C-methylase UbiE
MTAELAFTGERYVPGVQGEIWIEHWHRYHFAARMAAGKRVLDVACGEGYGSALLALVADSVTGADLSAEAIAHARAAYPSLPHLAFIEAPCTRLPVPDASFDLVVSFETVEHIQEQGAFVDEIRRVLAPGGVLLISCPNKREYSDRRQYANEFHVKELYRDELASLLARRFAHTAWYGQRPGFFSVIAPESQPRAGQLVEVEEPRAAEASPVVANPMYFLVCASDAPGPLAQFPATLSVLSDRDDWLQRDYVKVTREAAQLGARARMLETQAAELARERDDAARQRDDADAAVRALEGRVAEAERRIAGQERALVERDREILRRGGWRWWLRLPLVRLGLVKDERAL